MLAGRAFGQSGWSSVTLFISRPKGFPAGRQVEVVAINIAGIGVARGDGLSRADGQTFAESRTSTRATPVGTQP